MDPITQYGLECSLEKSPQLMLTTMEDADVVVVALDKVDAAALHVLESLEVREGARFVVLVDRGWYADPASVVASGVRAVLWREDTNVQALVRAVITVANGQAWLPPSVQGRLLDQVQQVQQEILSPRGLTTSGLTAREIDVLRMVSEGLDLAEIAQKMSYSERTIKKIIAAVISRLQLRNRVHAVTYAIRAGLI
ncbi:response regulator transcription factor [Streptomyces sp. ADI93-02]|uniref:helix-turn-helix transcriptional regulator n=1 Tax=Streptomyces sp. ADI93-02 TaxID=1522757 RepID=UPI001F15629C|nr:response regulator transcription factor [Streptomyces sp. ADI93-02]